jgi:hypothetical protein
MKMEQDEEMGGGSDIEDVQFENVWFSLYFFAISTWCMEAFWFLRWCYWLLNLSWWKKAPVQYIAMGILTILF